MSPKVLAAESGLSVSYINEIEKGKKYPRSEKIMMLAKALNVAYDDLISLKLNNELKSLSDLLQTNVIRGMPLEVFGIPAQSLFEMMANAPEKFSGFIGALIELARSSQLSVEDFFYASLRAYLDQNNNYFPELEREAQYFRKNKTVPKGGFTTEQLETYLKKDFSYEVGYFDAERNKEFARESSYVFIPGKNPKLLLHDHLKERDRVFILAKEIAHAHLKLEDRFLTGLANKADSFATILNNFKASYFATALLFPRETFISEILRFFSQRDFDEGSFIQWMDSYSGDYDAFFHRLAQILPNAFSIERLFMLQFYYEKSSDTYELHRELHLSQLHAPHEVKTSEHYCRRWITTTLCKRVIDEAQQVLVGCQISKFPNAKKDYFCLSVARPHETDPNRSQCTTLGLELSDETIEKIAFLENLNLPKKSVSDTCERCSIEDCSERAAPPIVYESQEKKRLADIQAKDIIEQN